MIIRRNQAQVRFSFIVTRLVERFEKKIGNIVNFFVLFVCF